MSTTRSTSGKALVIIAVAAGAVAAERRCDAGGVWNISTDFSSQNGNPNGAWSYGWKNVDFSGFTHFTDHFGDASADGWTDASCAGLWKNIGRSTYFGNPPGDVSLHPGCSLEPATARWTAPAGVSGSAHVTGQVLEGDQGAITTSIAHNNVIIWTTRAAGAFDETFTIAPGDTIDFMAYQGFNYGNTPVEAVIEVGPSTCAADLDGDLVVGGGDIAVLLGEWGVPSSPADLSGDGTVSGADITVLLGAWGPCP